LARQRPASEESGGTAVHQTAARHAGAAGVLNLSREQVSLIEIRWRPFSLGVEQSWAMADPVMFTPVNAPASSIAFDSAY